MKKLILALMVAAVSSAAVAEPVTLICPHSVVEVAGKDAMPSNELITVRVEKGVAHFHRVNGDLAFPMQRVVNDKWKEDDKQNVFYQGTVAHSKDETSTLVIVHTGNDLAVQWDYKDHEGEVMVTGIDCVFN